MSDLPSSWKRRKLGDILTFNYGKNLPERSRQCGSIPVYGSNGRVGSHRLSLINGPAIIVGRKGSVGEVHFSSGSCWPIDTTYFINEFGEHSSEFWFLYLKHLRLGQLDRATAIPGLNREDAYKLPVNVPPPNEQREILVRVNTLLRQSQNARQELIRIPRLIERYKQAILAAAFKGTMTAELRAGVDEPSAPPAIEKLEAERKALFLGSKSNPGQYVRPERDPAIAPFSIPDAWLWLRAEAVCDFITKGTTPPATDMTAGTGEIPYIKVYNLTFNASLDFALDPTFISKRTHEKNLLRSKVYPGDVLINIVGPPLGKVSIVPDTSPEWNMNQAIAVFRPIPMVNRRFLAFWLLSQEVLTWAISRSKATAGQANLTLQICRDLPIPVCSVSEQDEIVKRIDTAFAAIDCAAAETRRATDLLDRVDQAILAKAFCGELGGTRQREMSRKKVLAS
jgi:type I restriction enzyme, S subunit